MDRSADVLWIVSGGVALFITVDDFMKGCHVREQLAGSVRQAYMSY
jgi:hypothetical protein